MPPKAPAENQPWTINRAANYLALPPMPPPEQTRPVTFCIPDHPDWRASLYRSISLMQSWLAWKRDADHTGAEVAAVWRDIIQKATLTAERGEPPECMDMCAIIADCLSSDASTIQAIRNLIETDSEIASAIEKIIEKAAQEGRLSLEKRTGKLVTSVTCDDGSIFKRVTTLVDSLHEVTTDLFQIIEVATNPAERAAKLISAIPVIGQFPVDDVIEYVQELTNDLSEEYQGAWTATLRDELRCDLFCEFKDQCGFSLEEVTGFYLDKAGAELELDDLLDGLRLLLEFLVSGNVNTNIAVYGMHLLVLAIIRSGQEIMGTTFNTIALRIEADANEIDDDYLELCSECVEPPAKDIDLVPIGYGNVADLVWLSRNAEGDLYEITVKQPGSLSHIADWRDKLNRPFTITYREMISGTWMYTYNLKYPTGTLEQDSRYGGTFLAGFPLNQAFKTGSIVTTLNGKVRFRLKLYVPPT